MKKLIYNINFELLYLKFAKVFVCLIVGILGMNALLSFMDYQFVSSNYNSYINMQNYYEENGLDIEEDLESDNYEISSKEDGTTTVENPILYYYDQVSQSLFVVSPQYAVSHILELSILIFPLLFSIFGILIATNDLKNKMYKHKILRFGKNSYFCSKIIVSLIIIFFTVLFTAFISKLFSFPIYNYICSNFPIEQFETGNAELLSSDLIKVLIIMLICLVYLSIGFFIGTLSKNSIISICIISAYLYIIPIFSEFEIKNCCYRIMKENFNFYGIVNISSGKSINFLFAIIIILITIIVTNILSYIIIKKRSAFV